MRGNQKWLPRFLVMVKWHMGASKKSEFAQMQGVEKITQRRSWDEIWFFRGIHELDQQNSNS